MTDKNNESALLLRVNKRLPVTLQNISGGLAGCLTCLLPQSGSKTVSTCSLLLKNGIPLVQITVQNTCV